MNSELALALESALPVGCGCNPRVLGWDDIQNQIRLILLEIWIALVSIMTQRDQTFIKLC